MPRLITALALAVTIATGLGVRALLDGAFSKYAGDALYTVAIYLVIVFVKPYIRPISTALPAVLRPVLGSTFNPPDLFWYAVGAIVIAVLHRSTRSMTAAA